MIGPSSFIRGRSHLHLAGSGEQSEIKSLAPAGFGNRILGAPGNLLSEQGRWILLIGGLSRAVIERQGSQSQGEL